MATEIDAEANGPQFDETGRFKPYSILGSLEDFHARSTRPATQPRPPPGPPPERGGSRRSRRLPTAEWTEQQDETRQARVLRRWEEQGSLWHKQQLVIAERTKVPPAQQAMHKGLESHRLAQEIRTLIERAVPALERGRGARVGSEFWRPQEFKNGIPMTLTETEKGNAPPIELIRRPAALRSEVTSGPAPAPWTTSYLGTRQVELSATLSGLVPAEPDADGLVVIGRASPTRAPPDPEAQDDSLEDIKLVVPGPVFEPAPPAPVAGPACTLMANGNTAPSADGCRVLLSLAAGKRAAASFEIANTGQIAMYYRWEPVPRPSSLGAPAKHAANRFYFDRLPGVLLPGERVVRHVTFVSVTAGMTTESWRLVLQPGPAACAAPMVVLAATAAVTDDTAQTRAQIERSIERRAVTAAMRSLVDAIISALEPRPAPPRVLLPGPAAPLLNANKGILHTAHPRAIENLRQIYEEAWGQAHFPEALAAPTPVAAAKPGTRAGRDKDRPLTADSTADRPRPPPWDLSIAAISKHIYAIADPSVQAALAARLDERIAELNSPQPQPTLSRFDLIHGMLCSVVDRMVVQASRLRTILQLPEPPFVVQQADDDAHADTKGGKAGRTGSAKRQQGDRKSGKAMSMSIKPRDFTKSASNQALEGVDESSGDASARRRLRQHLSLLTREMLASALSSVEPMLAGLPRHETPSGDLALLLEMTGEEWD